MIKTSVMVDDHEEPYSLLERRRRREEEEDPGTCAGCCRRSAEGTLHQERDSLHDRADRRRKRKRRPKWGRARRGERDSSSTQREAISPSTPKTRRGKGELEEHPLS